MIEVETTMRFYLTEMTQECIEHYIKQLIERLPFKSDGIIFNSIDKIIYYSDYTEITIRGIASESLIIEDTNAFSITIEK